MKNIKKQPTKTEKYAFYGLALIGTLGTLRNMWRISRKAKQYINFKRVASNHDDLNEVISILQGKNAQKQVIVQSVLPNFKKNYFQPAQDLKKFKSMRGNFYQNLQLQGPFDGFLSTKKKKYKIEFIMNRPKVSHQLVTLARFLDEKGSGFNKSQPVTVYGDLMYLSNKKKIVFDTKLIGLNGLSMVKYFQIHIISILLSTILYSILLGIALAIYLNRKVVDQVFLKEWYSTILRQFTQTKVEKNKLTDKVT